MADVWDQFADAPVSAGHDPWAQFADAEPATAPEPEQFRPTRLIQMAPALGEMGLMAGTGIVGQTAGGLAGLYQGARNLADHALGRPGGLSAADRVEQVSDALTYRPRGRGANAVLQDIGGVAEVADRRLVSPALRRIGEVSPTAENVARTLPAVAEAGGTLLGGRALASIGREAMAARAAARASAPKTAEDVMARQAAMSTQNMGAAAAAPDLAGASPELKRAVLDVGKRGGVNHEVLQRHLDAESLPVPVRLTEGQATGDVSLLSREQNMRGRVQLLAKQFDDQNRRLADNLREIRDSTGPDVFSANVVEHGDALIAAYRAVDDAANANIKAAYDQLRQAAGGRFPIGAQALLRNSAAALHKDLLFDHAPRSVMNALARFAAKPGSMTFENFEALRTNLATIQRTATDGLERRAAGVIRQQMEDLPLMKGAERLKGIADQARRLAKQRFAALDADPAYKAAVEETIPPDRFVQRFVIGGTRDNLGKMVAAIPDAQQTMGVAVLDYLRDQARLNPHYEGNFAAASFSKALQKLSPSMRSLLPPDTIEQIEKLGRVATWTTRQPRGSFVNNSNTFTAAAGDAAIGALESMGNIGGTGLGTTVRRGLQGRAERNMAQQAIRPGAGIERVSAGATAPRAAGADVARPAQSAQSPASSSLSGGAHRNRLVPVEEVTLGRNRLK